MISFQLDISRLGLTLICRYYLKKVAKVNWKKKLVQIKFTDDTDIIYHVHFLLKTLQSKL